MGDFWSDAGDSWDKFFGNKAGATDQFVNTSLNQAGTDLTNIGTSLGFIPKQVDPNAAGGHLDTSNSEEDKDRLAPLIAQLTQQAATGGGSWEQTLAAGTQSAQNAAGALGQSMPGSGYASALRNIGNAQAGAAQRGVGEGNILRAQAKTGAQDQLTNVLNSQGDTEANQAAAGAAAQQGIHDLQNSLNSQASKNFEGATGAIGNAFTGASKMSDGGSVPGQPKVFGDDSVNDTVPAKLSPGEIVIPRSHAGSPEAAAEFVRALQARGPQQPKQNFDEGGTTGDGSGLSTGHPDAGTTALQVFLPHIGQAVANSQNNSPKAPSIENGGLMDTRGFDANREAMLQNSNLLRGRANGVGPSVVGQQRQNQTDANLDAAMRAPHGGVGAADILGKTTAANQAQAGEGAATAMGEQTQGQQMFARALAAQRNRDNAFAQAQQQAAFRNTQINAGLDLAQQAQLRGILSGAGQAAVSASSLGGGDDGSRGGGGDEKGAGAFGDTSVDLGTEPEGMSGGDEFGAGVEGVDGGGGFADGGFVDSPTGAKWYAQKKKSGPNATWTMGERPMDEEVAKSKDTKQKEKWQMDAAADDHDLKELSVQMSMGGKVPPEEAKRAAAFVSALKRKRAA